MKLRLIIKLMIVILVLTCAGPFFIKDKEGKPLITVDKLKLPQISLPKLSKLFKPTKKKKKQEYKPVETELLSPNIPSPAPGQEVIKIYTYKDERGISHYTNKEPDRDDYKVLYMPVSKEDKKNILTKLKEKLENFTDNIKSDETPQQPTTPQTKKEPSDFSITDIYTNPSKAVNDARELKKQVESQFKEREEMLKE